MPSRPAARFGQRFDQGTLLHRKAVPHSHQRVQPPAPHKRCDEAFPRKWFREYEGMIDSVLAPVLLSLAAALAVFATWLCVRLRNIEIIACEDGDGVVSVDSRGHPLRAATRRGAQAVLFAGSFNPVHDGHLAIFRRIARSHPDGIIYAVIGSNPTKRYLVTPEERVALLKQACRAHPELKNVVPVVVQGYVHRFARERGVAVMYRGIRSWAKDGADERLLHVQNLLGPLLLDRCWPTVTK